MKRSEVIVRPATREDLETFSEESLGMSIKAWVGELDGKVVAIGGAAWVKGRWFAFLDLKDEARPYKLKLARSAKRFFAEMHKQGAKFIYAQVDTEEPNAVRWLSSLGFTLDPRTSYLYRWRA